MTDYDLTDVNILADQVTVRSRQLLGPDAEVYACDAATEIIESLGVFSLAGLGLDACATDDVIRRHSSVPRDDEDEPELFPEDPAPFPGNTTAQLADDQGTDDPLTIYGLGGITNHQDNHEQIWGCMVCSRPTNPDQLVVTFEHFDGRRVNIPVSAEDLTNMAVMFAQIAQNPEPLTADDFRAWMEE